MARIRNTPLWADFSEIKKLYKEAQHLSEKTGIPHTVDHIIPLQSRYVSGLHVHTNMRVITEKQNLAKSNHWNPHQEELPMVHPPIYIFDLDGTLANCQHRLHHIQKTPKDWDAFYRDCINDTPMHGVVSIMNRLALHSDIRVWTGRSDMVRAETEEWLRKHTFLKNTVDMSKVLRMRVHGDHTEDVDLKRSWLLRMGDRERENVAGVFEDRSRVAAMWRANGLMCFQVAEGDF